MFNEIANPANRPTDNSAIFFCFFSLAKDDQVKKIIQNVMGYTDIAREKLVKMIKNEIYNIIKLEYAGPVG